jgi:WD40 repeat protein
LQIRRSSLRERCWLWCRRNPALAALVGLVTVLLVTVAVVASWAAWTTSRQLHRTEAAEKRAREDQERALQAERKARLREAEALVGQAHGIRPSRRPGQRFDALEALGKAAAIGRELGQPTTWFDRLRNEAIAALALPDVHITREWAGFPPGSEWVDLDEDFEWYARTDKKGACSIRRVADDQEVARLLELGEPAKAQFGPGRALAVHGPSSGRFQLWDLGDPAKPARRLDLGNVCHWDFRPDGRLLGIACLDGSIGIYEVARGVRTHRLAPGEIVPRLTVQLHPTKPFVATSSYFVHRLVQVRDLRTGAVVASALCPWPGGNGAAAWSPDGRTLTVPQGDGGKIQQYAFDPAAPALPPIRTIEGLSPRGGMVIAYNPTGDRFIGRGWSNTVDLFEAVSGQLLFRTHALPTCGGLRFDRTGQRLACPLVGERKDRIGLWSVADGREYRSLVSTGRAESKLDALFRPAIHPGGRLAAVGLPDGVAVFDLESGGELAHVPIPGKASAAFDGVGNLLTNGYGGCFRWPLRLGPKPSGRGTAGPLERLPFKPGNRCIAASRDGRVIAQGMWFGYGMPGGGWILHPNSPAPRCVEPGKGIASCSVSPDGRWIAFGVGHVAAKVYDAATAQCVWQSPGEPESTCRFSADGRWLVTNVDGGRVYAAGTWEPGPQLGPGTPWDATSDLAVLGQGNGIYRLVELATGRELARLEDPEQNTGAAAFTPDGTKLVVAARDGLRVWDLRRIRAELAKLGLDWDAPAYPPAPKAAVALKLNLGELAKAAAPEEKARQDIARYRLALAANPKSAAAHNNLAWAYVTASEALRKPKEAVRLAEEAVRLDLKDPNYQNTLGAAYYRADRFRQAAETLEANLKNQEARFLAHDLYFLALACQKLGESDKARVYYQWALRWVQSQKELVAPYIEELDAFRAEAEAVLKAAKPKE